MKLIILLAALSLAFDQYGFSQNYIKDQYPTSHYKEWEKMNQSKEKTKEWFVNSRFGMFIHWGLYSIPAGVWNGVKIHDMRAPHVAEWIMYAAKIPRNEYAKLATQFNPIQFNADQIVRLAKDAGMKYIVITSKHHDGFALFDSKVSDFDVMDATPLQRDIVKELHDACKKEGLAFGVYYSHNIDWHDGSDAQSAKSAELNPNISEHEKTFGANTWDPRPNSFDDYLKNKAYPQVKELMNQYPDMKLLWYDMPWRMNADQSYNFYKIVHDIQPQILVNERIGNGFGDFTIPGDNKIPTEYLNLIKPWETVGTFNNSWGFNSYDNDWKSPEELLYWLVEIVSKGGNYMLNIGPTAEGKVPDQSVKNLLTIGKWLAINGAAIYNTHRWKISHEGQTDLNFKSTEDRATKGYNDHFTSRDFWFTQKDKKLFVIAFKYPDEKVVIKSLSENEAGKIKNVKMLGSKSSPKWTQNDKALEVTLPAERPNPYGYTLEISF